LAGVAVGATVGATAAVGIFGTGLGMATGAGALGVDGRAVRFLNQMRTSRAAIRTPQMP
jgi:hypothetical protein